MEFHPFWTHAESNSDKIHTNDDFTVNGLTNQLQIGHVHPNAGCRFVVISPEFQSLLWLNSVLENCQMSALLAPARKMSTFDQCGKQFAEEEQERCKLHQNILTKPKKKIRQFFSWNQSCQQLKSTKPQHFHEFSPKTIRQFFSGNQGWIFVQKMKISNSVIKTCVFNERLVHFYDRLLQFEQLLNLEASNGKSGHKKWTWLCALANTRQLIHS